MLAWLKGRVVVLWPDNDEPGYKHMRELAARLKGIAGEVTFLLPPASALGDAAADWKRSKTDLRGFVRRSLPPWGTSPSTDAPECPSCGRDSCAGDCARAQAQDEPPTVRAFALQDLLKFSFPARKALLLVAMRPS